jgi:hypothetical protein
MKKQKTVQISSLGITPPQTSTIKVESRTHRIDNPIGIQMDNTKNNKQLITKLILR